MDFAAHAGVVVVLLAVGLTACQGSRRNGPTAFRPLVNPVAADLAVTHRVGQLNVNQGILLTTVTNHGSPLPLNQQLVNAVNNNDWDRAKRLLDDGAKPNAGDYVTGYALPLTVRNNNLALVKLLVEQGADLDIAAEDGETALAKAINQGNLDIATYLLEQGARPDQAAVGQPPLILAIQTGRPAMVELLLSHGANPKPDVSSSLLEVTSTAKQQAQERYETITAILQEAGAE
jgi:ankyrin repeat protein